MMVVTFAMAILPGWFQLSESAGKSLSPHNPAASSACKELAQASCVNLSIRLVFFVTFQSPRIASSRQSTGMRTWSTQLFPLASGVLRFGSGNGARYAWPAGLSRLAGMTPGVEKAPPVAGSTGTGPHDGVEKLPLRSAAVGTQWV